MYIANRNLSFGNSRHLIITSHYFFQLVLSITISASVINAQIINEIMFNPSEINGEFIEIFNNSDTNVALDGWSIKYHSSSKDLLQFNNSGNILIPGQYGVILEGDYEFESGEYYHIIPSGVMIIFIDNTAFGRSGMSNSSDRKISLISQNNDTVNAYIYSADNPKGFSDERVQPDNSIWKNSLIAGGTPGKSNSVSPREYDIGIRDFYSENRYTIEGENAKLIVNIVNNGQSPADSFAISIYGIGEFTHHIHTLDDLKLNPNDSLRKEIIVTNIKAGDNKFLAVVSFKFDEFSENDSSYLVIKGISVTDERGDIIINEIMYAPENPEPEWLEIFNRSDKEININKYKIADRSDTVNFYSKDLIIRPKEYYILSDDSLLFEKYGSIPNSIVINLPSLNNSGDDILLLDSLSRIIDSLFYENSWGGKNGNSLERIDPDGLSTNPMNWISSYFPTPGTINSVTQKEYDLMIDTVFTTPEFPIIDSNVRISARIKNIGKNGVNFVLNLLEDKNYDGVPDDLIDQSDSIYLGIGDFVDVNFAKEFIVTNSIKNIFLEIQSKDDDTTNNKRPFTLYPSFPERTIIINEVMYYPANYEPEWVELFNNSEYDINLHDWSISDVLTRPVIKTINEEFIFPKNTFLIITKSDAILDFHKSIECMILNIPFANLNNDKDGFVIRDKNGKTIDSLLYSHDLGNKYGYSIERKNIEFETNNVDNWSNSTDLEGSTPCRINSITPKEYDIAITALYTEPRFPVEGENVDILIKVTNYGIYDAENFCIEFYLKEDDKFRLYEKIENNSLNAGDSLLISCSKSYLVKDTVVIAGNLIFEQDLDKINNYHERNIIPGFNKKTVLINEIMFKPNPGLPEWIEIVNNCDTTVNIKNWLIGDSRENTLITDRDLYILPDDYLLISEYTSNGYFNDDVNFVETDLPELNNHSDAIAVYDFRYAQIDSTFYKVDSDFSTGTSLERISFSEESCLLSNWIFSFDPLNSTPGILNSVSLIPKYNFGDIIITEVMYEPDEKNCEFIEIFNNSANKVEIGGWKFIDEKGDYYSTKKQSCVIGSNDYFIVSADSSILINYDWLIDYKNISFLNVNSLGLNNSGGEIILKDIRNNTIDSLTYFNHWHNSTFLSTKNISLELINSNLARNNQDNWSSSVSDFGATPGKPNSIYVKNLEVKGKLNISPNPFSPDNDGFEDYTFINYKLSHATSQIRVRIFDSKGRYVRSIANNKSAGSEGTLVFDGLDQNGNPLRIGMYIIFFEAVSSKNKIIETFKEVVVVARKL